MVANQRVTGRARSIPTAVGLGLLTAVGVTAAGCGIVAAWIDGGQLSVEAVGYGAIAILLSASFLGAALAIGLARRQRLQVALILGTVYYVCLLLVNGLAFGGELSGAVVTALVILAGCICAAMLPAGKGNASGRKRRNMVKLYKNAGLGK